MKGVLTDTVLVGIDEAGLGPILGPLIVSAASLTIPTDGLKDRLWGLLAESVGAEKKHLAGRLLICDSKKAYTPSTGIKFLEKTVLSSLSCIYGKVPASIAELVDMLCPACKARLAGYPWHKEFGNQPIEFNRDDIAIAAGALTKNLEKIGVSLAGLKSFCFDVAYYNEMVQKVNNKSTVLFWAVCSLVDEIIKSSQHRNYYFIIDRQGGRTRYTRQLRLMFGEMELKVIKETDSLSSYELSTSYKKVRIDFAVKADSVFLPTALASMTSKYLREQLMASFNSYFIEKCSQLKPTAGYWTDGKRFINDLKTIAPQIQFDPSQLIRCR
jgi:ribonuclease HII